MAKRRRAKREFQIEKRCDCREPEHCDHDWGLRVHVNGERQRVNLTRMFPGEAVDVAAAKARDLARKGLLKNGKLVLVATGARLTLSNVADKYKLAYAGRPHYYLAALCEAIVPATNGTTVQLGQKAIDDVTAADVKHVIATWLQRKRTRSGAKGGQVAERHLTQVAHHLFSWACTEGFLKLSPLKTLQGKNLIKVKKSKARTRRLSRDEEARILAAADPFIADFFRAMLETGCRPGELRTLQWSEMRGDHFVVLATKAKDREERDVPIEPALRAILDRRRVGPDGQRLSDEAFVFGTETGEELHRRHLCELWTRTCAAAKVTDLHLHDLRREFASQLAAAGVPIAMVRDALGHQNISMTNTYLGINQGEKKKAYAQRTAHRAAE